MKRDRYAVVCRHFATALEMSAAEQLEFIRVLRAEDSSVADEVLKLLKGDRDAGDADFLGHCVPGYSRLEPISRGGQGTVYRATQNRTGQQVAVKIIAAPHLVDGIQYRQAADDFAREIETVAGLRHPNIVRLFDAGTCASGPFLVMELIEGGTLAEFQHRLNQYQSARIIESIADAVSQAHAGGVFHLDIKPQNILFDDQLREPCLVDFGLARLSGSQPAGRIAGTISFMAPEQIEGGDVDERTDVYGLGATLYYLLTGRPIRNASTLAEARSELAAPSPGQLDFGSVNVNSRLVEICRRCLEVDPQQRYPTASELYADLNSFRASQDTQHITMGGVVTRKCAGLLLAINVVVYVLLHQNAPASLTGEIATWASVFAMYLVVLWILSNAPKSIFAGRQRRVMASLWAIWVSNMLAAILIAMSLYVLPDINGDATKKILMFYPMLSVLTGVAWYSIAPHLWRRFYWFAAGCWMMSIVILVTLHFSLQIAPLVFGAGVSVTAFLWSLQLKKVAQGLQTSEERRRFDDSREVENTSTVIA